MRKHAGKSEKDQKGQEKGRRKESKKGHQSTKGSRVHVVAEKHCSTTLKTCVFLCSRNTTTDIATKMIGRGEEKRWRQRGKQLLHVMSGPFCNTFISSCYPGFFFHFQSVRMVDATCFQLNFMWLIHESLLLWLLIIVMPRLALKKRFILPILQLSNYFLLMC